jgi:hypothetical protein
MSDKLAKYEDKHCAFCYQKNEISDSCVCCGKQYCVVCAKKWYDITFDLCGDKYISLYMNGDSNVCNTCWLKLGKPYVK